MGTFFRRLPRLDFYRFLRPRVFNEISTHNAQVGTSIRAFGKVVESYCIFRWMLHVISDIALNAPRDVDIMKWGVSGQAIAPTKSRV